MKTAKSIFVFVLAGFLFASAAQAAGFKVYGYKTRKMGEVELVYFNNYFLKSDLNQTFFNRELPMEGHLSHSFEIEYGFSNRWTVSLYVDAEQPKGEKVRFTRLRSVFFRYRFFEKGDRFFDTAIYAEYYIPRKSYKNEEELEVKLILEKDLGSRGRIVLNPSVEKALSGPEVEEGLKFNYAAGLYLNPAQWMRLGVEFFGKMGEIAHYSGISNKRHWVFPSMKLKLLGRIGWDVGVGFGLTDVSDDIIIKNILSIVF